MNLQCPHCDAELTGSSDPLRCSSCAACFPVRYGIPDFSHNPNFYWGELDRKSMQHVIASDQPVAVCLKALEGSHPPSLLAYLEHYALDTRRAGWKFLLPLQPDARILDFACGWGGPALSLAPHATETWVADIVPERVAVTLKRSREMGLNGVCGCVASGWPRLPFADGVFSLVVVNGALEWLPTSIDGPPTQIQERFLSEVARVLSSSGQLVLGIENRYGIGYFTGRREEHTKLRFISLLPRVAADVYHRLARKTPFRTYTYGRQALIRLMTRSGFECVRCLYPYPDYREFDRIVDPDDQDQIAASFTPRSRRGRLQLAVIRNIGGLRWFANSFLVIADRSADSGAADSFVMRLVRAQGLKDDVRILAYRITAAGNVCVRLRSGGGADGEQMLTLPVGQRAAQRLTGSVKRRTQLIGHVPDDVLTPFVHGRFEGVDFVMESWFDGVSAQGLPPSTAQATGVSMLRRLHGTTPGAPRTVSLTDLFEAAGIERFFQDCRLDERTRQICRQPWPAHVGCCHGDFHLGNILVNRAHDAMRLIDWDLARLNGLPLWDALNLWVHAAFEAGASWPDALLSAWRALCGAESSWLRDYVRDMGCTEDELRFTVVTFALHNWSVKMRYGDGRSEVITNGLNAVLCEICGSG